MFKKIILSIVLCIAIISASSLSVFAIPEGTLKLGSKGPDVKELQQKLSDNGYLDKRFVTGFFGPNTVDAVAKYQKTLGINETGIAAETTIEALFVRKELDTTMVIKLEDESIEVRRLQQALCDMGYLASENVTGYYGENTEKAVKKFQSDNGIDPTGTAAKLTLEKINALVNVTELDTDRTYKSGDEDSGVKELQQRLCDLGYLESKYVTGYYGAITVSAVKKFQKSNQISETGVVAELTLNALNSLSAKINTDKSDMGDYIAKPGTLRFGDRGAKVKTLQNNLKKLGYFSGTATGEFGDVTKQSVIKFQKAHSLTADGIVTSKTQSKISAALSAKTASSSGKLSSSSSTASSSGVTVSGYDSANMDVVNSALSSLSDSQMDDVKLMARIIKREVGGSSYKCQLAVGSVIMNRVRRTGASVHDIIYSPNQFSSANSSLPNETYSTSNLYAAIEAYMGVKPIGNCLYFCSQSIRYSCWMGKNRTYYCTIGTECFFL